VATHEEYAAGDVLRSIPRITLSQRDRTLFLVLSSKCAFCDHEVPFYSALASERERWSFQMVVLGQEPREELVTYLESHSLKVDAVQSIDRSLFPFRETPTLVLVDHSGRVEGVWRGALRGRESEVKSALLTTVKTVRD
jgi:hypothetical protein